MEEELKTFIKAWVLAIISASYCYYIPPRIKAGFLRLFCVLPVCVLFLVLPFFFSSTIFSFITSTFLTWLANLKLILFAFDLGPLFPLPPTLFQFICFTCLSIHPLQSHKSHGNQQNPNLQSYFLFAFKAVILGAFLLVYPHIQNMPLILLFCLYPLHLYLSLEMLSVLLKTFVTITLGCDLEPQFNEPYLATSLQDFWGRRWNLVVPAILGPAIYIPLRRVFQLARIHSDHARFMAVLATFIASGVAHDVLFFTLTSELPTGEVTCFFVLHGVCTAAEVAVKRTAFGRRLVVRPAVSRLLTVGFVVVTGGYLFFPQFKRSGVMDRFANESLRLLDLVKRQLFIFSGMR